MTELVNPQEIPWTPDSFGSVPDINMSFPNRANIKPTHPDFHSHLRVLKNAFCNIPATVDSNAIRLLQKHIEVSVIADIFASLGREVPGIPSTLERVAELRALGIPDSEIVTAPRGQYGTASIDAGASMLFTAPFSEHIFTRRRSPEQYAAELESVRRGVFLDVGLLSKGVGFAFGRHVVKLQELQRAGVLTDVEAVDLLNNNFGFAAGGPVEGQFKGGVSLHILDRILELNDNPDFILNVCDDAYEQGRTLNITLQSIQTFLTQNHFNPADIDSFMHKVNVIIPGFKVETFEITQDKFTWKIKEQTRDRVEYVEVDRLYK